LAAFAVGFLIAAIVLNRVANDTARDQVAECPHHDDGGGRDP